MLALKKSTWVHSFVRRWSSPTTIRVHSLPPNAVWASSLVTVPHGSITAPPGIGPSYCKKNFSYYVSKSSNNTNNNTNNQLLGPSYQIYGEETSFTVRAIPPEFRSLASGKIVLNNSSRGRLLLQWNPRGRDGKYDYDHSIRFALSAEEAASVFLARLDPQSIPFLSAVADHGEDQSMQFSSAVATAEIVRRPNSNNALESMGRPEFVNDNVPDKVFRARLYGSGSVELTVDFERDGIGGQDPPTSNETVRVVFGKAKAEMYMEELCIHIASVCCLLPKCRKDR